SCTAHRSGRSSCSFSRWPSVTSRPRAHEISTWKGSRPEPPPKTHGYSAPVNRPVSYGFVAALLAAAALLGGAAALAIAAAAGWVGTTKKTFVVKTQALPAQTEL